MAENPITGFQSILFEAQRQILANGKNIDAILRILAQTSCDLFDVKGLAVIFMTNLRKPHEFVLMTVLKNIY